MTRSSSPPCCSVVRKAGIAAVRAHWPGTADGFSELCRLTGLPAVPATPD